MEFILGLIGAFFGILLAIAVIAVILYNTVLKKLKRTINSTLGASGTKEIINAVKNTKSLQEQEYTRIKDVGGMTTLVEPRIINDFPEFNKEVLYSKVEKSLIDIFEAIESKSIKNVNDDNYDLIRSKVEEKIKYLTENNITEEYSDVKFHKHALKQYIKIDGMAVITISSTLEYYYKNSKKTGKFENLKRQTRYTTKFAYILDESKINGASVYTINCPNCGAPLKRTEKEIICEFCLSHIQPVNLKIWKISSYEEDYKTM